MDTAKRLLREILDHLQPELESGTPIVVLEPSCAAVFRDELVNLFPEDANAKRLCQQTFLLSEFLDKNENNVRVADCWRSDCPGPLSSKSLMGMESEARLLSKIGLEAEILDSGCCGMARSFGFEAGESQLIHQDAQRTYALIFDKGDEFISEITRLTKEQKLDASHFMALGAFRSAVLGFFDMDRKDQENFRGDSG